MELRGTKYSWTVAPAAPDLVREIRGAAGVTDLLARVLAARGLTSGSEAARFLRADPGELPDKSLLPDAEAVVRGVAEALSNGTRVVVHGHDDADGVTAAAIMYEALSQLGADVLTYVPDRRSEGHGLNRAEIDRLRSLGVGLIVTVDSCVSDVGEIAYARDSGIETIVTDHHEIPRELPVALAIVNAKLPDSRYPYRYLAGAGVALRIADLLLEELSGRFGSGASTRSWYGSRWYDEALALAALGSVADKVPLTGDNRSIVRGGLAVLPATVRPGLRALLTVTGHWGASVSVADVQESIGPMFGRVSDGTGRNDALDLLLVSDLEDALERAHDLDRVRAHWKAAATAAWKIAEKAHGEDPNREDAAVVLDAPVPLEVVGYVTSRLSAQTGLPVVVVSRRNGSATAEARGPAGFDFADALDSMRELFVNYGGHPRAAGFTILTDRLPELKARMLAYARSHPPARQPRRIDAMLPIADAGESAARELKRLGPFGQGNAPAVLLSLATGPADIETAGRGGLRFSTPVPSDRLPGGIVYRLRETDGVTCASILDVVGTDSKEE